MLHLHTERVLVVPTSLFRRLGYFQGFSRDCERYFPELLKHEHVSYRERPAMETDPSFKQLIPYCILRHVDRDGTVTLFQYTRGNGQGEGRLHAKQSIGIGGHISSVDAEADRASDPYAEGLRRELEEEVAIDSAYTDRRMGLINDDETEVGRVHLGVVHVLDLDEPLVAPRESEMIDCGFRRVDELLADTSRFESWSRICLEALFSKDEGGRMKDE